MTSAPRSALGCMDQTSTPTSRRGRVARVAAALLALAGVLAGVAAAGEGSALAAKRAERPNVVVVMTDDQDLSTMRAMPLVGRHLARKGTTFLNSFASFPLCCPSRASFLTGQYAHNHGVLDNKGADGGYEAFDDRGSLPVALRRSGYRTGFVGKYLNQYGAPGSGSAREVPRGWSEWHALSGAVSEVHRMYGYRINDNGRLHRHGSRPGDYQTDVLARKATRFVRTSAERPKPFFLTLSTLAPHTEKGRPKRAGRNPRPAPRHERSFVRAKLPGNPAFNERDVSDKPSFVSERPPLRRLAVRLLRERHQDRMASLLAVDDAVGRLVRTLRRSGELGDTLVVFTSDNGYMLGAHRLRSKEFLYEESARVPLVMRGPGVPAGEGRAQLVSNVDLAPTILDFANARPRREPDGRSLRRLARKPRLATGRDLLLENGSSVALRTPEYMYAEHLSGERELYDLVTDPFQLESLDGDPAYGSLEQRLAQRLEVLRDCAGKGCR